MYLDWAVNAIVIFSIAASGGIKSFKKCYAKKFTGKKKKKKESSSSSESDNAKDEEPSSHRMRLTSTKALSERKTVEMTPCNTIKECRSSDEDDVFESVHS